jgi:hypothetical protein
MSWRVRLDVDKGGARGTLEVTGFASQRLAARVGTAFLLALVEAFPGEGKIHKQVLEDERGAGGADHLPVPAV